MELTWVDYRGMDFTHCVSHHNQEVVLITLKLNCFSIIKINSFIIFVSEGYQRDTSAGKCREVSSQEGYQGY